MHDKVLPGLLFPPSRRRSTAWCRARALSIVPSGVAYLAASTKPSIRSGLPAKVRSTRRALGFGLGDELDREHPAVELGVRLASAARLRMPQKMMSVLPADPRGGDLHLDAPQSIARSRAVVTVLPAAADAHEEDRAEGPVASFTAVSCGVSRRRVTGALTTLGACVDRVRGPSR